MQQKNIFPLQIFIIMEKININFWTNKLNRNNLLYIYIKSNWIILFNLIIKHELFINNNTLIEYSYMDFTNQFLNSLNYLKIKGILFLNIFFYQLKFRLIIIFFNNVIKETFQSIDKIFFNSDWLEREIAEMYSIKFLNKNDSRNLLLEYSKKEAVMRKDYFLEGFNDVYYSFFENQVVLKKILLVEL